MGKPVGSKQKRVAPKQMRGDAFVSHVLDVTVDELLRYDFGALSVETIASAAGVNKTSVYRRWGSLEALVRDAGNRLLATLSPPLDTGSLRGDLLHYFRGVRELLRAVRLRAAVHLPMPGAAPSELEHIRRSFEEQKQEEFRAIFRRGVARGEVSAGAAEVELVGHVLAGAILQLTLIESDCDDAKIANVIDLVMPGISGYRAPHAASARARKAP